MQTSRERGRDRDNKIAFYGRGSVNEKSESNFIGSSIAPIIEDLPEDDEGIVGQYNSMTNFHNINKDNQILGENESEFITQDMTTPQRTPSNQNATRRQNWKKQK